MERKERETGIFVEAMDHCGGSWSNRVRESMLIHHIFRLINSNKLSDRPDTYGRPPHTHGEQVDWHESDGPQRAAS